MSRYTLVTQWHLAAPIEQIWRALTTPREWPGWWRYVKKVEEIAEGDADGLGAVRRFTWTSRLPYELTFDMRTTALRKPHFIEGVASGELNGSGRWRIAESAKGTRAEYEWSVDTGKRWMNILAPLLAPAFRWNHGQVMREGARGLACYLGVELTKADP